MMHRYHRPSDRGTIETKLSYSLFFHHSSHCCQLVEGVPHFERSFVDNSITCCCHPVAEGIHYPRSGSQFLINIPTIRRSSTSLLDQQRVEIYLLAWNMENSWYIWASIPCAGFPNDGRGSALESWWTLEHLGISAFLHPKVFPCSRILRINHCHRDLDRQQDDKGFPKQIKEKNAKRDILARCL